MPALPILYSFRRCPYAIRARMALVVTGVSVELREVLLRDKPLAMLEASAKSTVPVLVLPDGRIIDESLDVMSWALSRRDPEHWLRGEAANDRLIQACERNFKPWLDRYKYADRYPEQSQGHYRGQAEVFLSDLEGRLSNGGFLTGNSVTFVDVALFPFVRQFAGVDPVWWRSAPYPRLRCWLEAWLASVLFTDAMVKHPPWQPTTAGAVFPTPPAALPPS